MNVVSARAGSSPHTRGAPEAGAEGDRARGIIPAYAGSTFPGDRRPRGPADHPRIRGEHLWEDLRGSTARGSSPHTRGAPRRGSESPVAGGIIPAYAGSTGSCASPSCGRRDHPRIRGEHAQMPLAILPWTGSSPHTRGAPQLHRRHSLRNTDHPRIRGEHLHRTDRFDRDGGSSPHTRGVPE